ncbi:cation:dicarboxylate symporter family transporter [Butyrivibrio sp. AE3009]|uniref:cation:dicarboxylate symporter family transporter n=1 Tax=Butyrivibrio sp. AE3009 TaxID=1280666 RepID=UPI0003B68608|nr:cation:dicarboxylase symporter family transporter [Butyrivibrio sp. AE3009]
MLSVSVPGIPGANMVFLSILLAHLEVPVEAVGLVLGIDAILDMIRTVSNTTGDIAVSLIVAKSENLVDMTKWEKKNGQKKS